MSLTKACKKRHQWEVVKDLFAIELPFVGGSGCSLEDPIMVIGEWSEVFDAIDRFSCYYGLMRGLYIKNTTMDFWSDGEDTVAGQNVEVYDSLEDKHWEECYWFDLSQFIGGL
jgi:hypothetical protein